MFWPGSEGACIFWGWKFPGTNNPSNVFACVCTAEFLKPCTNGPLQTQANLTRFFPKGCTLEPFILMNQNSEIKTRLPATNISSNFARAESPSCSLMFSEIATQRQQTSMRSFIPAASRWANFFRVSRNGCKSTKSKTMVLFKQR